MDVSFPNMRSVTYRLFRDPSVASSNAGNATFAMPELKYPIAFLVETPVLSMLDPPPTYHEIQNA
jgi:hypothetical protein